MSALTVSFSAGIAFIFPQFLKVLEEHLSDNNQEVLPHLLISDYCRFTMNSRKAEEWHKVFLDYLEENYTQCGDEVSGLISVSFIENLPYPPRETDWVFDMIGSDMKKQYNVIFGLRG